ncbi:MAG: hypothetical protein LBF72_03250, partial [Holosporales bacterium]|nr:hypothetical protein [Holosporales bacterium]
MNIHFAINQTLQGTFPSSKQPNLLIITRLKLEKKPPTETLFLDCVWNEDFEKCFPRKGARLCALLPVSVHTIFKEGNKQNAFSHVEQLFSGSLCSEPILFKAGLVRLCFAAEQRLDHIKIANFTGPRSNEPANFSPQDISKFVFEGSVTQHHLETCYPAKLTFCLVAEWLQHDEGIVDIGPQISCMFPNNSISSFNNDFVVQGECNKTGYQILRTNFSITEQSDALSGAPLCDRDCNSFKCEFKLGWSYEQKRIERLFFSLPFFAANTADAQTFCDRENTQNQQTFCYHANTQSQKELMAGEATHRRRAVLDVLL